MKRTFNIICYLLLSLIFGIIFGFLIQKPTYKVPEGKVLLSQIYLDSLRDILKLPPIITVKDTIIYDTVWINDTHYPIPVTNNDSSVYAYRDSLKIKDQIDVSIKFNSLGVLTNGIDWLYKPIIKEKTITIEKPVPYPMPYEVPVVKYKTGVYLSGVVNGCKNMYLLGSDLDIVTKNDYIYGIQYRRFENTNLFGFKIGFKLFKI